MSSRAVPAKGEIHEIGEDKTVTGKGQTETVLTIIIGITRHYKYPASHRVYTSPVSPIGTTHAPLIKTGEMQY